MKRFRTFSLLIALMLLLLVAYGGVATSSKNGDLAPVALLGEAIADKWEGVFSNDTGIDMLGRMLLVSWFGPNSVCPGC